MKCPVCKGEVLIGLEYQRVEVDYCDSCHGIWLDSDEIELLLGDMEATTAFLHAGDSPADAPHEKPRRCPECNAKMMKERTAGEHSVMYDRCPNDDGVWFDDGELHTIVTHSDALGENASVARYLAALFAPESE